MRRIDIGKDSPVRDKEYPPGVAGFSCPSEGDLLFGIVYYAEGRENPTIVLCHGFPGMEKNYDLAHMLRQAGFNVVIFSYRGSWGSQGSFSFSGVTIDTVNIVHHITSKKLPHASRFDFTRLVLVGHSMGAFAAFRAAAVLPEVKDVGLLAVWNIGLDVQKSRTNSVTKARLNAILSGTGCLGGTSQAALWDEMLKNAHDFDLLSLAPALALKRVLLIGARKDEATPIEEHQKPIKKLLRHSGAVVTEKTFSGDHLFSSRRHAVARSLLEWLTDGGY